MDIQKEREAFLAHMRSIGSAGFMFELDEDGNFDVMSTAYAWSAWQAAKSQAVPEGFAVVPIDDLTRAAQNIRELNNGEYYSEEIEENVCTIEAMIEAQEPAND